MTTASLTGRVAFARPWTITILLALFMYINFADKAVIGLAAVPMMRDMALSPEQWGLVGSSFFALFSLSALLVGVCVDRVPAKWALAVMGLVWAVTQLPMVAAVSFPALIACRVALGAGEGPAYPVAIHAAYKWFPDDRRTLPTSIIAIGAAVGVFTIAPVLVWLIQGFGWHWAFGFLGVAGLAWVLAWIAFGAEGPITVAASIERGTGAQRIPFRTLFASPTMIGILVVSIAAYWILALLVAWVPALLQQGLGYGPVATTVLVSLTWGGVAVLMPLIGFVSQRAKLAGVSSRAARAVPASVLAVAGGGLVMAALAIAPGGAQIALMALGISVGGAIFTLGPAIIGELAPADQRGTMLGSLTAIQSLAGLAGPLITGRIIGAAASAHDGYIDAFMLAGALAVAGGLAGLVLMRPEADLARFAKRLARVPAGG